MPDLFSSLAARVVSESVSLPLPVVVDPLEAEARPIIPSRRRTDTLKDENNEHETTLDSET